jgi:hypothetical protein
VRPITHCLILRVLTHIVFHFSFYLRKERYCRGLCFFLGHDGNRMASDAASHSKTTVSSATQLIKPEKLSTMLFQTLAEHMEYLGNTVTHCQCVFRLYFDFYWNALLCVLTSKQELRKCIKGKAVMVTLILTFSSNSSCNVTLKPYREDYFEGNVA